MIIGRIVDGVRIGWGILTGLITAVRTARGGGPTAAELHDELHVGGPTADQMKRARQQAAAIFQLHSDNEKLLDWIEANLPSRQPLPRRAPTPPNGTDIVTLAPVQVARKDPRREP